MMPGARQARPVLDPVTIAEDESGHFVVSQAGRSAESLIWDEAIAQVIQLSHPEVRAARYRMASPEEVEADRIKRAVRFPLADREALALSFAEAEELSARLSDFLCWSTGYAAALPHNPERHPYGVETIRRLNLKLKSAMEELRQMETK